MELKFVLIDTFLVLSIFIVWFAILRTVSSTQKKKYKQMEHTVVTASEQIMNMSVESAVSIAKNIYTNEAIYNFLNKRYSSSSEYYEAYYPLQQNTAMNIADTNIVKCCNIYTDNPTILSGGSIYKLETAADSYWYECFRKMNKATVLCIDPDTNNIILVRKLDYMNLDTGESYLTLELNGSVLNQFADNLEFDGELYIMSGGELLYSSDKSDETVDDVSITPAFECITRNYYTLDIAFYSCAARKGIKDFVIGNKAMLVCLAAVILLVVLMGHVVAFGINNRIKPILSAYGDSGGIGDVTEGNCGKDEIGKLIDVCCGMSKRLMEKGSEFEMSSDSLMRKSSDYESLFTAAMRMNAELLVREEIPEALIGTADEYITLSAEAGLLGKTADKYGAVYSITGEPCSEPIPAYSLVLIAADAFSSFGATACTVKCDGTKTVVTFEGDKPLKSAAALRLRAIFEGEGISEEYSFERVNRYNPYLRLKHCLGKKADAEVSGKNSMKLVITIDLKKEKGE